MVAPLFMYPCYKCMEVFCFMIKQSAIFARRACWVMAIVGIVSLSSTIVANQLSPASASVSSTPLKACSHHPCALFRGSCFCLNPICGSSINHQFIASAITLMMPYQPTEVVEYLLQCLYTFIQQMTVIYGMFFCYVTYNKPQCRPCSWSFLSFQPQRHQSSSCNIIRKD